MRFGMGIGLKNARNYNADYALEFNGTNEYLQIALPSDLAIFDLSALAHGSTSLPTGWGVLGTATTVISTTTPGSSKCMVVTCPANSGIRKQALTLTSGKKYKFTVKYKQTGSTQLYFGQNNGGYVYILPQTSEWSSITLAGTATNNDYFFVYNNSGTACTFHIEYITVKEDQGFDLNKDQEQILHSKNWDFERTSRN
jgi:hypothetical protein